MKAQIKVTYPLTGASCSSNQKFDEEITNRIESIGGKWWAQGLDCPGTEPIRERDICFDIEI